MNDYFIKFHVSDLLNCVCSFAHISHVVMRCRKDMILSARIACSFEQKDEAKEERFVISNLIHTGTKRKKEIVFQ